MKNPQVSNEPNEITYYKLNNELNIPIDNKIPLEKDKEAVRAFFLEHVNPNTVFFYTFEEKIRYLIDHDYLDESFINKYDRDFIYQLMQDAYDRKFRFQSFMGAYKFYTQYAMKTDDGERYLERYEDRVVYNALYLADGDEDLARKLCDEILSQRFQPATPTFLNAGRKRRGEMVSCFLIQLTDDMNSIGRGINSALQLSKRGGGVGINLSNLREEGAPIKKIENAASGVVPVMKLFEDCFSYANQLGQRNGAGVVYLNVFHPDIVRFLSTKKENADEKIRVKTLSLGITVPDKFYELVAADDDMYLFSPYDVERIYGKPFSYVNITEEYDRLVHHPEVRKYRIRARELENEISKLQQESGYPYIVNIDTANEANPIDGTIVMSNLCSEILQIQDPSKINDEQLYDHLGTDISCNLGSTNMVNMVESDDFARSVETAVRGLTFVTDSTDIEAVPSIQNGNQMYHTIGLGAMGLHTLFAINHIYYGSDESLELTEAYFYALNYWSLKASHKIAVERGQRFANFENSAYADGSYFEPYIEEDFRYESDKVAQIMAKVPLPSKEDWQALRDDVMRDGLYHAYRLAVAPTGSISYVNETSASLQPIIRLIEERQEKKTGKTYYPAPQLSNDNIQYYESAYDLDMRKVIDVYAAAQQHVDQGMSMTLFMRSDIPSGLYPWKDPDDHKLTTRDLNILRNYAWNQGIKSIYYIRTFTDDGDEIGSNYCESCSI
ncbi:class 1b ribonucleoside-diphosphate reductase subunit alpha [Aerococcus sp. HMSC23C02]|uniref:class 1b ribonucleoside-diphosphate reductase subunit alpha n=1 Tax=Aerococcus sp. HMSC23C02 TaxID=1581058 RepID=UPI0008A38E2D|nr:class 1b ribonucleoside-diphosphate reductase subunit alpha [Aerococcus sp. HMSC23C02]OFT96108.1 ribonucleotide-diphosphate reductase subunit alpha [Aerococcus sp. HMSC23C02]